MVNPKSAAAAENLGLDIAEYKDFLIDLADSVQDLLNETIDAINSKDHVKAAECIHSIKGSVGSLGLSTSFEKYQHLEDQYKIAVNENSLAELEEINKIYRQELAEMQEGL